MKKCSFWKGCCYHDIPDSAKVYEYLSPCKLMGKTIVRNGGYAIILVKQQCCRCEHISERYNQDHDISRANKLPRVQE